MNRINHPSAATRIIVMVTAVCFMAAAAEQKSTNQAGSFDPINRYEPKQIEGWRVWVNRGLLDDAHQKLAERTLKVLGEHLFRVSRVVPAGPLVKLRQIPIWVELAHPLHPCMCYHPDAGWLSGHGMNPEKAGAVEIANAENFLAWTIDQPWMLLHEMAHGYHHQVIGHDHAGINACFDRAVASKSYESVLRISGRRERAYALSNAKEYFAECTEAFLGTNDFYPFVRAELQEHDPAMYELLTTLWGVKK